MPTISQALANALQHHQAGRLQTAEEIYRRILQADPNHAEALHLLGVVASQTGRHESAVEYIARAIALHGTSAEFHHHLAKGYRDLGRMPEAIASCRRALELKPDLAAAHNNLGNLVKHEGKLDEAAACFRRALELEPGLAEAHNNLGLTLTEQGKWEEAIACFRRALELKPLLAEAHNNLANAFMEQGKLEKAVAGYRRALELRPDDALARRNLAVVLLLLGRYHEGWIAYESRLALFPPRDFSSPRWNQEPAEGQTILLCCEQGFGDSLQFIRYAPLVRKRAQAQRVILECQPPLARLLAESFAGELQIVARGGGNEAKEAPPAFDWHLPLLSLPLALGIVEPMPMSGPYLLADPALRAVWRDRLGPATKLRVGLAWQGNPEQARDRCRSIPPERFLPLLKTKGAAFHSLQVEASGAEAAPLAEAGLIDLTEHIHDFADTAALMAELDLIIAVDTATIHLAGALGRPVWTLLQFVADWRWGMEGETTPWYPTMRLFRQNREGDWDSVLRQAAKELEALVNV